MSQESSHRYARALFELAKAGSGQDEVYDALQQIGKLVKDIPEFYAFLGNPLLSLEERNKVLTALFKKKAPDLVFKFLLFVSFKSRLNLLPEMIEAFDQLYLQAHNRIRALVQTALPLDGNIREQIKTQLGRRYQRDVVPDWQIRQDILGGFRIVIEGKLHDSSFTSQLQQFKQQALH